MNQWEIHTDRVIQFDPSGSSIRYQYPFTELIGKDTRLAYDSINRQYWLPHKGLCLFDVESASVKHFPALSDHPLYKYIKNNLSQLPSNFLIDDDRHLWIAFWGGQLLRYHLDSREIKQYHFRNPHNKTAVKNAQTPIGIHFFFIDRYRQIWLTTYGLGLLKHNEAEGNFDYILADKNDPNALQYNHTIYSVFQDWQDNIWVGTDRGISIFNPNKSYFESIGHRPGDAGLLPPSELQQITQLSNGDIWVSSWGGGITVFDANLTYKNRYTFGSEAGNMVWAITKDHKGRVWVTGQRGLIHRYNIV